MDPTADLVAAPITLTSRLVGIEARLAQIEARVAQLESPRVKSLPSSPPEDRLGTLVPEHAPPIDPTWAPVIHRDPHCQRPAFYLTRPFGRQEQASLQAMRVCPRPERFWREPTPGEIPRCSSCDTVVDPWTDADLDWTRALLPVASAFGPSIPPLHLPPSSPVRPTPEDPTGRLSVLGDLMTLSREIGLTPPPSD